MKARHKRFVFVVLGIAAFAGATAFVLMALEGNLNLFRSPTQVVNDDEIPKGRSFRLGGLVEEGSLRRQADGVTVEFYVRDLSNRVKVQYTGILPDLFKEGQSVVTQGTLNAQREFVASEVLAKHDEEYMPKEIAQMLEERKKGATQNN